MQESSLELFCHLSFVHSTRVSYSVATALESIDALRSKSAVFQGEEAHEVRLQLFG